MNKKSTVYIAPTFLWEEKGHCSIFKKGVDKGLAELDCGVQLMRPIDGLEELLKLAVKRNIFGTKMRFRH